MPISGRLWLTAFVRCLAPTLAPALALAGAGVGAGAALRFLAVEPEAIGRTCASLDAPSWCVVRQAAIVFIHWNVIGGAAAAAGAFALLASRREGWREMAGRGHARRIALLMGGLALVLYNAGLGSVAVVLGLLAAMDET